MNLSTENKGLLALIAGSILILHTVNFRGYDFKIIIIVGALALIYWGFMKLDGYNYIKRLLNKGK